MTTLVAGITVEYGVVEEFRHRTVDLACVQDFSSLRPPLFEISLHHISSVSAMNTENFTDDVFLLSILVPMLRTFL